MYFGADDGVNGYVFWESDGTTAGTVMIEPVGAINSDPLSSTYEYFEFSGDLYFQANYTAEGGELWKLTTPNSSGIEEANKDWEFVIYPNPASSKIIIAGEFEYGQALIFDLYGEQVMSVYNQHTINIEHLVPGTYIVRLVHNNEVSVKRFVKQ